jgi:two-component system NtrC family sensor kinase
MARALPAEPADQKPAPRRPSSRRYRALFWHNLKRLTVLYFLPLLLLAIAFHLMYRHMARESHRAHLAVLAEHQANTLDLFLRERLVNLANLIDDPQFAASSFSAGYLANALAKLRQTSPSFVDLGVVNRQGDLVAYVGPVNFPKGVNYAAEPWFRKLTGDESLSLITDIYLGFRGQPHFTVGVKRGFEDGPRIVRSALSPEKLREFLTTLEGAQEVVAAVVNAEGRFQLVTPSAGPHLEQSGFRLPREPRRGFLESPSGAGGDGWAYAWLKETPWALAVSDVSGSGPTGLFAGGQSTLLVITVVFFVLMGGVILVRVRQIVGTQLAAERHEAELSGQLVQAAKLASVGELAAGIAHEINNPLAIIAEEVGLLRDSMDPEIGGQGPPPDLNESLQVIREAVFRCRDITRKLLTFVRRTDVKLEPQRVERILDEVLDGMLGRELTLANIEVVKDYDPEERILITDRNQLVQVFLNLVKNAVDAMPGGGTLTVRTAHGEDVVVVSVRDTGCGMTPEQRKRLFMPFYTTKAPGKGTGLGLSVSASIIKNFGGNVFVESAPGKGSVFTVELPYEIRE